MWVKRRARPARSVRKNSVGVFRCGTFWRRRSGSGETLGVQVIGKSVAGTLQTGRDCELARLQSRRRGAKSLPTSYLLVRRRLFSFFLGVVSITRWEVGHAGTAILRRRAPGGGRTHNLRLRRPTLYPVELRARAFGIMVTHLRCVASMVGFCFHAAPQPRKIRKSTREPMIEMINEPMQPRRLEKNANTTGDRAASVNRPFVPNPLAGREVALETTETEQPAPSPPSWDLLLASREVRVQETSHE